MSRVVIAMELKPTYEAFSWIATGITLSGRLTVLCQTACKPDRGASHVYSPLRHPHHHRVSKSVFEHSTTVFRQRSAAAKFASRCSK